MERSFLARSALFLSALALVVSGCDCGRSSIGRNLGDVVVVWRDAAGERVMSRDALYDFGKALVGERKTMIMTVRNQGAGRLTLASLARTEGDEVAIAVAGTEATSFEAQFTSVTLDPSAQVEFEVAFTPRGLKGTYLSKLALTTEGTRPEDSVAVITLKGEGEKGACDLPSVIDFGKVPVGETWPYAVEYANPTSLDAIGYAGAISGADAVNFGYGQGSPVGNVPVHSKSTAEVIVTFAPTEARTYEAQVTLRGAGECPEQVVTLKGEGGTETLTWSPTTLKYGFVNPGAEALKEVIFVNPASTPIVLREVTSTNGADFYHAVPAGQDATRFTVPGNSVPTAMKIACNPSQLGGRTGTLTFKTGLTNTASGTITLECTGGGPKIRVTPRPTLAFGRVGYFPGNTNFTVQRKVNVQNVGSRPPTPDPTANLFLGQVAVDGTPGQLPLFELTPGPNTAADEFVVNLASAYNPTTGLEAVAGRNFVDISVRLTPQSVGLKSATLTIHSNDPSELAVPVTFTADVQQLPPCDYVVSPAEAVFGLVTPPTSKDLPITITNRSTTAGNVCYLSGIDLAPGTDPAYSIVGGPIVEKELQPQESVTVVVRVAPAGAVPATLTNLTGALVFNATSPTAPQGSVPLRTAVGPSCLAVTPDPMDFGTVKVGCNSNSRDFNVYNVCSSPVTITGFAMQAAGGQPPGGPNCQGTTPCPEFRLVSTPMIPSGGLTLQPGAAPLTFQARFSPLDVGPDSGAVAIDALQNGQSITYLVGLQGRGDTTGQQVDVYTQDLQPKADILLVVDDSCSMQDKQNALAANFSSFIQYAVAANVDYQIGVTTTSEVAQDCLPPPYGCVAVGSKAPEGKLVKDGPTGLRFITPRTPNVSSVFSRMVNVGTQGASNEAALATSVLALTPPVITSENAGFLRTDANLAVVVISDAGDQSSQAVSYYQNRLVNIKGFQRLSMFTFSAIGPFGTGTNNCAYDGGGDAARYSALVNYTSGVQDEICNTNWSGTLQNLGRTAFGYRTQFYLGTSPDTMIPNNVVVKVNGVEVAPGPNTWTYDGATNSVKFAATATPGPGQPLEITYISACFP